MSSFSTVLVSGANRGLGLEFCSQLLEKGSQVIATCRQPDSAEELQRLKRQYPEHLTIHPLDVNSAEQRQQLADALSGIPVDLLINNAGIYGPKSLPLGHLPEETWLSVLETNVIAPVKLVELLQPNLKESKGKAIAFLSSKMGSIGDNTSGGAYIYRSSKAALNAAIKSLSIDLAKQKIKVIGLHPGWVKTDMGGPNALISPRQSVDGMLKVIHNLTESNSGQFVSFDGNEIPW